MNPNQLETVSMNLIRDGVFKRNIHGYMEYTRVQLYTTHLRQIPMYVVYLVHNDEVDLRDVEENGHWFICAENTARFVKDVVSAWARGGEAIPSIDLTDEIITALTSPDEFDDKMYRVVFNDRLGEIPKAAMGSMPYDRHQPWFVSSMAFDTAKYNIYPKNIATVVARLNATMSHKGYVNDRICMATEGAYFTVEEANYHPSGIPQGDDKWIEVDTYPAWNRSITINFTPDMTGVCYDYVAPCGTTISRSANEPNVLEAMVKLHKQSRYK